MEKIICSSCGATMTPNSTQPFLTCEYCDTTVPNAYYVQDAASPAMVDLPALCVEKLIDMGRQENLADVADNCFGNPIQETYAARDAMDIPAQEKIYFVMDRSSLLWSVEEGLALADSGLFYKLDGQVGRLSWESFITGAVSCTGGSSKQTPGALHLGGGLVFPVTTDEDARLARFLIDFHNQIYRQYTGETAPKSWTVSGSAVQEDDAFSLTGLLGTVATVAGSLLRTNRQRTVIPRSIVQRPAVQRSYRPQPPARPAQRPAMPQRMPRPNGPQAHRPHSQQPGGMFRPSGSHGGPGRRGGPGSMGGPGRRR